MSRNMNFELNRRTLLGGAAAGAAATWLGADRARAAMSGAVAFSAAPDAQAGADLSDAIGDFAANLKFEDIPARTVAKAKERILDAIACSVGAADEAEMVVLRESIFPYPGAPCTLIGSDEKSSPAEAAFLTSSLARNLDYMDTYVGPHGGGHPSNCLGPIVACAEYAGGTTRDMIAAYVAGTEVLGAFADIVNTRQRSGVEHVGYVSLALTAAAGRALQLDAVQMKNAVSIVAASYNPLQVTRAEQLTMWKGFAEGFASQNATMGAVLAMNGMIGPTRAFDGQKGWKEVVAREQFDLTFTPGDRVHDVWTKFYLAETYALSAVEGAIELARDNDIDASRIKSVTVRSFSNAVSRLGATAGRDVYNITTKPEADHSFPYMIAAALIDRALREEQYTKERINSTDVQALMRKVRIEESERLNNTFKHGLSSVPAEIDVVMDDGSTYEIVKDYFTGHPRQPADKALLLEKLRYLIGDHLDGASLAQLIDVVEDLENRKVSELTEFFR